MGGAEDCAMADVLCLCGFRFYCRIKYGALMWKGCR